MDFFYFYRRIMESAFKSVVCVSVALSEVNYLNAGRRFVKEALYNHKGMRYGTERNKIYPGRY